LDEERQNDSFFGALFHPARKLTNLEKILSGLAILFLILMSTFIGLFAGTKGALSREKGKDHHGGWSTSTVDHTHTATATTTISAIPTGKPTKVSPCPSLQYAKLTELRRSASLQNVFCSPPTS
jgi:endothelin-converting enzyme